MSTLPPAFSFGATAVGADVMMSMAEVSVTTRHLEEAFFKTPWAPPSTVTFSVRSLSTFL